MKIYPAIDILNGQAVRLTKGDFATAKTYSSDPRVIARDFKDAGSTYLHVIDLDGAKQGKPANSEIIADLAADKELKIQVGGGVRSLANAAALIHSGVDRVIIGSLAVKDPDMTASLISEFGANHITLALDCQKCDSDEPLMAIHGWQTETKVSLWQLLDRYLRLGSIRILCTDIDRDGMNQGSNLQLYRQMLKRYPGVSIQASGGIASLLELEELAELGMESCVIGKSLYEGNFALADALRCKGVSC